jgi:hypothetical protein
MGNSASVQLSFEERVSFLRKTPFFIHLQENRLIELAECFQHTLVSNEGDTVKLDDNTIYIVTEGELELSALIPTFDKKNESRGYLCKKKPGDILSKRSANKHAVQKVTSLLLELFTAFLGVSQLAI